ncbi:MAG: helix-turn-helix transcriptional regulator, partial [Candidatus Binataceae bacterium]
PPYGILGRTMETSASFEARSAPSSHPTIVDFQAKSTIRHRQALFPESKPPERLIRLPELLSRRGLSKRSIYRLEAAVPSMIPLSGLARPIKEFRAVAKDAGRNPNEVVVKSPGHVTITNSPERARTSHAGMVAFYAARMGTYYSEQLTRYGFGEDVAKVREWAAGVRPQSQLLGPRRRAERRGVRYGFRNRLSRLG